MTEERPFIDKALGWQIGFLPRFLYQPLSECCLSLIYIEKLFKIPPYTYRTYLFHGSDPNSKLALQPDVYISSSTWKSITNSSICPLLMVLPEGGSSSMIILFPLHTFVYSWCPFKRVEVGMRWSRSFNECVGKSVKFGIFNSRPLSIMPYFGSNLSYLPLLYFSINSELHGKKGCHYLATFRDLNRQQPVKPSLAHT